MAGTEAGETRQACEAEEFEEVEVEVTDDEEEEEEEDEEVEYEEVRPGDCSAARQAARDRKIGR